MIILTSKDSSTKKFISHIEKMSEIAQQYGYVVKHQNGVIGVYQEEYDFYNTGISVFHKWNDDCNDVYYRFAVSFSGFGAQEDEELENKISKSLENAKTCVDALNIYLKKMEKDYGPEVKK